MSNKLSFLVLGMVFLGGCASGQQAQEISRLKSDIGLLDQRLSQIERSSLKEQPDTTWPTDVPATVSSVTTVAEPQPVKTASSYVQPSKREIQQALKNAGFYQGSVDGKMGPQTREAIKQFQQSNGLKADGIVGRQTWSKLEPYLAKGSSDLSGAETIK
jgi:peptidoglycan hydrolase-like protein with peptidoglycan-binding domain